MYLLAITVYSACHFYTCQPLTLCSSEDARCMTALNKWQLAWFRKRTPLEPSALTSCLRPARWRQCQTNWFSFDTMPCQVLRNSSHGQQLLPTENRTIATLQLMHGLNTAVLAVNIYKHVVCVVNQCQDCSKSCIIQVLEWHSQIGLAKHTDWTTATLKMAVHTLWHTSYFGQVSGQAEWCASCFGQISGQTERNRKYA